MQTNKQVVEEYLNRLAEIHSKQSPLYKSMIDSINSGVYENDLTKCKRTIMSLELLKEISRNDEVANLINKVIEYFDSLVTALVLLGEKIEEKTCLML